MSISCHFYTHNDKHFQVVLAQNSAPGGSINQLIRRLDDHSLALMQSNPQVGYLTQTFFTQYTHLEDEEVACQHWQPMPLLCTRAVSLNILQIAFFTKEHACMDIV